MIVIGDECVGVYRNEIAANLAFFTSNVQAYVSTDAVGNGSTLRQSGGGLVKIPYRIFVGGIAFNTTKEELKEFFSRYGAVRDTKIIRDQEGLSKGYGFVTFYREEDAQKVMNMGTIFFKEKRLNISEAYRKHALPNQQVVTMPVAVIPLDVLIWRLVSSFSAPTSWTSASSTPVYYTTLNQVRAR
ncbi:protein boule-like [Orbicella faveolata]|uniref:protein boule-like n=1 Tax=Orbicella faveolata TaxID=48498 RepID=UPI0009E53665|nr:protein boule-like [Orbicella faveolata]